MADRVSSYLGKKYACPGCHANLKFRRPPTKTLLTCPSCRRKLKLQEQKAVASRDELVREAIDSLVSWRKPEKRRYEYRLDPKLNNVDSSTPGLWKFDQPWPEHVREIAIERAEVLVFPFDEMGTYQSRTHLVIDKFPRVTVERTGEVEEMEVTAHWYDLEPHDTKVGLLSRQVVRDLNRIVTAKHFAARINCLQQVVREKQPVLELYIDVAVQELPQQKSRPHTPFR